MAIGCLAALREAGNSVPEDFALAGFDDIPIARFLSPALTSVRVSIAELGASAAERVLAAIEGGPSTPETSRNRARDARPSADPRPTDEPASRQRTPAEESKEEQTLRSGKLRTAELLERAGAGGSRRSGPRADTTGTLQGRRQGRKRARCRGSRSRR